MVAWWSGDGDTNDLANSNTGTLQGGTTIAPGKVGQGFSFNGTTGFVQVTRELTLGISDFTIDLWANFNAVPPPTGSAVIFIGNEEAGKPITSLLV